MRCLVDTSALYALLDEDDDKHLAAAGWLSGAGADPSTELITHNYVVIETAALVQKRLGSKASRKLFDALVPALSLVYVTEPLHSRALSAYLAGNPDISLVDRASFELVRDLSIDWAFAFDAHFRREGVATVP